MKMPGHRLATVTVPAPDLRPGAFLRAASGEPRGFAARGEEWVACTGVAAELRVNPGEVGNRFGRIGSMAKELAEDPVLAPGTVRAPLVRFYGGFSFSSGHQRSDVWRDFPDALFHLPRFELEGDATGDAWLRMHSLVPPSFDGGIFDRMRDEAEALRGRLMSRDQAGGTGPKASRGSPARVTESERRDWLHAVNSALEDIRSGSLRKVVLARVLEVMADAAVDPVDVVGGLWNVRDDSHVFLIEPTPGSALVGAAPETVATLRHGVFHATAAAGSIRKGADNRETERLGRELLSSEKDLAEHRLVVQDMVGRLESSCHDVRVEPTPHVLALARIQHLESAIRANTPPDVGILDLLRLLHPTPAVCGVPRQEALAALETAEPFARGWYAGPVGWFDADGNGTFVPALRTGVSSASGWRLFAGAGIVEGSDADSEWEETALKFVPMLDALARAGLEFPGRSPASGHASRGD